MKINKTYNVIVNQHLCDGCGDCFTSCPINASLRIKGLLSEKTAIILVMNGKAQQGVDGCDGCGVCVTNCHKRALKLILKD